MKNQYETELNNLKTKLEDKSQESERLREEVLELRKSLATLQSLLKPAMENIQHVLSSPPSPPPDSGGAGQDGREEGAGSLSGDHQEASGPRPVRETGPAAEGRPAGPQQGQETQQDGQPGLGGLSGAHQEVLQGEGRDHGGRGQATERGSPADPGEGFFFRVPTYIS